MLHVAFGSGFRICRMLCAKCRTRAGQTYTNTTDIWSLGVVLYAPRASLQWLQKILQGLVRSPKLAVFLKFILSVFGPYTRWNDGERCIHTERRYQSLSRDAS